MYGTCVPVTQSHRRADKTIILQSQWENVDDPLPPASYRYLFITSNNAHDGHLHSEPEADGEDEAIAQQQPQRTGPMVAVYLDEKSVDKLHEHYPGIILGRLRKVVIQYNPSDKDRDLYAPHFGSLTTVKVRFVTTTITRLYDAACENSSLASIVWLLISYIYTTVVI